MICGNAAVEQQKSLTERWSFNTETFRKRPVWKWYVLKIDNLQTASTLRIFSFNMFWLFVFSFFFPSFEMELELITFPVSITTTYWMGRSIVKSWSIIQTHKHTQLQNHVLLTRPPLSNSPKKGGKGKWYDELVPHEALLSLVCLGKDPSSPLHNGPAVEKGHQSISGASAEFDILLTIWKMGELV